MREALIRSYRLTRLEKISSAVLLGLGLGMFYMIQTSSWFSADSSVINNPGFLPQIVSIGFILMSVILFISSLNQERTETVTINWFGILIVAVWTAFGILCKYIGFILAGMIALFATLLMFGAKDKKSVILTSVIAPVLLYLVLGVLLGVKLPTIFL